jgi:SAM-dependent methyltransferase
VFGWLQEFGGSDLLCDTHFLPFRDGHFDAVYTSVVTEHLACSMLAMQEFFRVLKPCGYYMGNCAFVEPWHDQSFFHLSPLGASELLETREAPGRRSPRFGMDPTREVADERNR